jgi:hypothetical protein
MANCQSLEQTCIPYSSCSQHNRNNVPHIGRKLDGCCRKAVGAFHFFAHAGATSRLWSMTLRSCRMMTNSTEQSPT